MLGGVRTSGAWFFRPLFSDVVVVFVGYSLVDEVKVLLAIRSGRDAGSLFSCWCFCFPDERIDGSKI